MTTLSFKADQVAARTDEYTPRFRVFGAFFAVGDAEQEGHHWNFTRSFDEDDGVCTVREPQRGVVYEGITEFHVNRNQLRCEFSSEASRQLAFSALEITYSLDEASWTALASILDLIFKDKTYYHRTQ